MQLSIVLPEKNVTIYYDNSIYKDVNIHYKDGSGTWTTAPGVQMNVSDAQEGYNYKYVINMGSASSVTMCFNNQSGSWDNNGEKNYVISKPGCYGIKNGSIVELEEIEEIPVEDLTLNKENIEIFEEEQTTVEATITPMEATDKTVVWKSSDENVAKVSNGVITGIKEGSAIITAVTSNGLSKEVKVTVKVNPNVVKATDVKVIPMELSLTKGDTYTLKATVLPDNTTNKTINWYSANDSVAKVTNQGIVTAVAKGVTEIVATTSNGLTAKVKITVEEVVEEFPAIENGVYFVKPSDWGSTIYAYMWIEENGSSEKLLGKWPGTKIDKLEGNIYAFSSTADEGDTMIIFNDGTNQTKDLKFYKNGYYDKNGLLKTIALKGKVYVKCVDEAGNVLAIKAMTGEVGSAYSTEAREIEGYTLVTTPDNVSGKYTKEDITVTYVYKDNSISSKLKGTLKYNNSTKAVTMSKGSKITLKVEATGGSGSYTYKFAVLNVGNGKWSVLRDFNSSASYTYALNYAGTKQFAVTVKDSTGKTVATNRLTVKVTKTTTPLAANLTVNNMTGTINAKVGDSVKLNVKATGGSGTYTYKYVVYNTNTKVWYTLKDYNSSATYTTKLSSAGTKQFVVSVKDSTGKTVSTKRITVKASK